MLQDFIKLLSINSFELAYFHCILKELGLINGQKTIEDYNISLAAVIESKVVKLIIQIRSNENYTINNIIELNEDNKKVYAKYKNRIMGAAGKIKLSDINKALDVFL